MKYGRFIHYLGLIQSQIKNMPALLAVVGKKVQMVACGVRVAHVSGHPEPHQPSDILGIQIPSVPSAHRKAAGTAAQTGQRCVL